MKRVRLDERGRIGEQERYGQNTFARHAGFERSNYGAIERGEFNVRFDTIIKVAAGLGMTVAGSVRRRTYSAERANLRRSARA